MATLLNLARNLANSWFNLIVGHCHSLFWILSVSIEFSSVIFGWPRGTNWQLQLLHVRRYCVRSKSMSISFVVHFCRYVYDDLLVSLTDTSTNSLIDDRP